MKTITKILSREGVPLGWFELDRFGYFAYSQNLSASDLFKTREEAIKFVCGSFTGCQIIDLYRE
jgi:hypothetical protein